MARIKGKAKGGDPAHGGIREDAARFIDACRCLPAIRRETALAKARGKDLSSYDFPREQERKIADLAAAALFRRDADFFRQIACRIEAAPIHGNVDEVTANIQAIWGLAQRPWDPDKAPRKSMLFRELLSELEECLPGRRFTEKRIREKAKALGVVFAGAGRPRKSP